MMNENSVISFIFYYYPFFILIISSIIIAILNLYKMFYTSKLVSYISLMFSLLFSLYLLQNNYSLLFFDGKLSIDSFTLVVWIAIIIGGIISIGALSEELVRKETIPLLLLSIAISLIAVSARDLLILFIAIEGSIFPAYALVFQMKKDYISAEATIKFYIFGIISTLLFSYSLVIFYGIIGNTSFSQIHLYISNHSIDSLLLLSTVLILISLSIKATLVPLHVWAIDTYHGAPTSISAFLSSSSKTLGIAAIGLLMGGPLFSLTKINAILYVLILLAIFTIIIPNVIGLIQRNIKRLLAYSSVAHAGYMALAFIFPKEALAYLGYYLITYNIAKAISFFVVNQITGEGNVSPYNSLIGAFKSNFLLSLTFSIALLSLAGIPPFAGFMAKFLLFVSVAFAGSLGVYLVLVALIMSAVSVYYYAYLVRLTTYKGLINGKRIELNYEKKIILLLALISLLILTFIPSLFIVSINM